MSQVRQTIFRVFKATAFILLLFAIEKFATDFWISNIDSFPHWLISLQNWLPKPKYPEDRDTVVELISVIASVTGVILALFYPIMATIASTAYAKVHASIRNLLLYEKETQSYLKRLTYLTVCSIAILLFCSLHILPGNLILFFLAIYTFSTIFGILKIGLGVYRFFEPSTLSNTVFNKLADSIKGVTTEGKYWNDRNFQAHNYKLAFEQIENLSLLTSLCLKDNDIKESSIKAIFNTCISALQYYLYYKPKIPVYSKWFPDSYHHKSFFESDMTARGLSQQTNTFIQPTILPNKFWFEEKLATNISKGMKAIIEGGYTNVFSSLILMSHSLFGSLSSKADLKTVKLLLDSLLKNMLFVNVLGGNDKNILIYEDWREELGCVEVYCHAILGIQCSIFDLVVEFDSSKMVNEFNKVDWKKNRTIYDTHFLPEIYDVLNRFLSHIENEKRVEGRKLTPDWYFHQSLVSEYLGIISEKLQSTVLLLDSHLLPLAVHFNKNENPLLASFCCQIGLEIINKISYRMAKAKATIDGLADFEVCKNEFEWRRPDFQKMEESLSKFKLDCYKLISSDIEKLSIVKWNNQFPDIFAHSYSLLLIHLNNCFAENKVLDFQSIFPSFLKSSLNALGTLNNTFKHYSLPPNITYQTIVDLMDISGYAYIYSIILNKSGFWNSVKKAWDQFFFPTKDNIELLVKYYQYYKVNLAGTGINFNEKHQRDQTLFDLVGQMGLRANDTEDCLVKPFIRGRREFSFYNVSELFIELYLFSFLDAKSAVNLLTRRDVFESWMWNIDNLNTNTHQDIYGY